MFGAAQFGQPYPAQGYPGDTSVVIVEFPPFVETAIEDANQAYALMDGNLAYTLADGNAARALADVNQARTLVDGNPAYTLQFNG